MARIFISYRRDDSSGHAGRLYDHLTGHFGQGQVFMDVDAIQPGLHFVEVVQEAVSACDALVAVIGQEWLQVSDASGARRLDDPSDMVRLEIATALERGIPVIPVLVRGVQMPREADLPIGLTDLAYRNALEVSDARFRSDVERLIEALEAPAPERVADSVFVEPARTTGSTFVGRDRELDELNTALEASLAGHGQLVMLVGEPGIGKTRTAQELASRAERRGAQVLWGRCYEEEGAPPYWLWVQPIRSYVQQCDLDQLASEMGPGAADIAESFPELRQILPGLESPPALEPEQARFRLFDSITSFFKNVAKSRPTMLVLDDLHWADKPSLLLLQFLAQEMGVSRLLVVGTYRDVELSRQHPLSETLAQLSRSSSGGFQRVLLRGLDQEDTARIIEVSAGIEPTTRLVDALYTHTEGNPFFMTEVIKLLSESGDLTAEHIGTPEGLRIPEGVREVIGQRLNRLSKQCNEVLTTASIVGREFDFRVLTTLSGEGTEDPVLEALEEALAARIIEEPPGMMGRYQFTHALIQETLAQELSTTRRARLHGRIGQALEELYSTNAQAHAAELAHHFAEAELILGPTKLVRYSLLAGEQALASYAYEDALTHFERGLVARDITLSGTEPVLDAESAALLAGLGHALTGTLERQMATQARSSLARAFDYYVAAGDSERAVSIVARYSFGGVEFIERALELVPPDSHDAGRLLSSYIRELRANYERAQEAFHGAMAIARQQQDLNLEMQTLMIGACVDFTHCRFEESLDRNRRVITLAGSVEQSVDVGGGVQFHARYDLMHVLYAMGDLEEAAQHASAMLELPERSGLRWQTLALEANENVSSAKGDWQAARNFAELGLALSPREANLLGGRALLEYQVGDFDAGGTYVEQLLENVRPSPSNLAAFTTNTVPAVVIPVAAYITSEMTRFDAVEAIAESVLASPSAFPAALHAARIGLALIAVQRGDAMAAGRLYGTLEPLHGTMSPQGPFGPGLAADRVLGLLAHTRGDLDLATTHFDDALVFCRKAGYRPELAWTCCDYADTLLQRNEPGDREKATSLLDESRAISNELGMRPLMERVLSRRDILRA